MSPAAVAGQGEMVFIAATNHNMPLSRFQDGDLADGLLKDLGDSIAQRMGLQARYLSVPAKRVSEYLVSGRADGVCYVLPRWLPGPFNWSQPLMPDSGVLVSRPEAPPVRALSDLANKPVGTVLGYSYSMIDAALGRAFVREDAPSMELNISKIQHGRMQYAIMGRMTAEYLMHSEPQHKLRIDFEFDPFKAQCAFSQKSAIPFREVQRAIGSLVSDGTVDRLLHRYR
ncbi:MULTISPECIES: ABC transporter substrate-binding protein [unclassified Duganella]|uniref:substrate-binding periplasmic protein n=1 Tax=unclassified Duganella TaxID=2636909 RepID=UPI00138F10C0|nr:MULTISPECIES: ABC transporter substrate-binding protein [unclassified Duganella]